MDQGRSNVSDDVPGIIKSYTHTTTIFRTVTQLKFQFIFVETQIEFIKQSTYQTDKLKIELQFFILFFFWVVEVFQLEYFFLFFVVAVLIFIEIKFCTFNCHNLHQQWQKRIVFAILYARHQYNKCYKHYNA